MKSLEEEILKQDRPKWFTKPNYLTLMGSHAYETFTETSDYDFYGFVVPPVEVVFPHLTGKINGFGRMKQNFEQLQHQHLETEQFGDVDYTVFNIVKYFQLLMEGNPNIIDSLFTPDHCLISSDVIAQTVRKNKHLFLSQKCYHTFKGMMWSHLSRIKSGHIKEGRKNKGFDWDVKDGYHSARMALQLKQICFEYDLDLTRNKKILLEIRHGDMSKDDVISFCENTLSEIEDKKEDFVIPYAPDEKEIKKLLIHCLELGYGYDLSEIGYKNNT
jgi:predicted nucleotidyltransferase